MVKVAVVGAGNMGTFHIQKYQSFSDVVLVAICDPNIEKVKQHIKDENVYVTSSLDDMIDSVEIDAISLTAPTSLHFDMGKKILKKGIHLLMEKPIATSTSEAEELIQLAKENQCVFTVGHIERFNAAVLTLKKLIDDNTFGNIASLSFRRNGMFPIQIDDANVVIDLAVHDVDIANYLLGKKPDRIFSNKGHVITGGRADHAECQLVYGNTSVCIQVNWITPIRVRDCIITGSHAYAIMNFIDQSITLYRNNASFETNKFGETVARFETTDPELIQINKNDSLKEELRHFIDVIRGIKPILVTPEQAKDALDIALEM